MRIQMLAADLRPQRGYALLTLLLIMALLAIAAAAVAPAIATQIRRNREEVSPGRSPLHQAEQPLSDKP